MKTYNLKKTAGTPIWSELPSINIDIPYLTTPSDISAKAQICYNDEEFLVHLSTVEKNIRAKENGPIGIPCEDSCLEFFAAFNQETPDIYVNCEMNSAGAALKEVALKLKSPLNLNVKHFLKVLDS